MPFTSNDIMNRMQEIGFNAALIREMRAVAFINKRLDDGKIAEGKEMLIHVIEAEDYDPRISGVEPAEQRVGFSFAYEVGRERAEWLAANFRQIGIELTVNVEEKYF